MKQNIAIESHWFIDGKIIQMASPDKLKEIAKSPENPTPTLEDAFIKLIEEYDATHPI